jgi:Ca2+-binding RTX toxin-like protein
MSEINTQVAYAIPSGDNDQVHITDTGLVLSFSAAPAFDSHDYIDISIDNDGGIVNTTSQGYALFFSEKSTGQIINEADGKITGASGVDYAATGASFLNHGSINATGNGFGSAGVYFMEDSSGDSVNNDGAIKGGWAGIADFTNNGGNEIINSGLVHGDQIGIAIYSAPGATTEVTNSGTIQGGSAAITIHTTGALGLNNSGKLLGDVNLVSADPNTGDSIVNTGVIEGDVRLGNGHEIFEGAGGTVTGRIYAGDGDDQIVGGIGNDTLIGGGGHDVLDGGPGHNLLQAGTGADQFLFDTALADHSLDRIAGFRHGVDKIELSHSIFTALNPHGALKAGMFHVGAAAQDHDDHVIYNPTNGWLSYDTNGSAPGGEYHIATLAHHLHLTASDFFVV